MRGIYPAEVASFSVKPKSQHHFRTMLAFLFLPVVRESVRSFINLRYKVLPFDTSRFVNIS